MLNDILTLTSYNGFPNDQTFQQFHDLDAKLDLHRITSGFHHGEFAMGVTCQQGTLFLPDTWFRPPFGDVLMLQLLRPLLKNLPFLFSTFHLEYPSVLSRFLFDDFTDRMFSISLIFQFFQFRMSLLVL